MRRRVTLATEIYPHFAAPQPLRGEMRLVAELGRFRDPLYIYIDVSRLILGLASWD